MDNGKQGAGPTRIVGPGMRTDGGIFYAKGPEFHLRFMAGFVMPFRREIMQMVMASTIQREGAPTTIQGMEDLVRGSYEIADLAVIIERETLDAKMSDYWKLYLQQGKSTDDVMAALQEEQADYSL